MPERWYLMPMSRGTGPRAKMREPKYLGTDIHADLRPLVDSRPGGWGAMDFPGRDDLCLVVCHNITRTEHAKLNAAPDVWDFPADLDRVVETGTRTTFTTFIRQAGLEDSRWFRAGMTYQQCIDEIMADLLHGQNEYGRTRDVDKGRQERPPKPRSTARSDIEAAKPRRAR